MRARASHRLAAGMMDSGGSPRPHDGSTRIQGFIGAADSVTARAEGSGASERGEGWWRWGRIELPVQNRVAGDFLQVFPAYLPFASWAPNRRGAPLAIRRCLSAL